MTSVHPRSILPSIIPGTYAYTLSKQQLFSVYMLRGLHRIVVYSFALFSAAVLGTAGLHMLGVIGFLPMVYTIIGISLLDLIPFILIFSIASRASTAPPDMPGGAIFMEWDSLTLSVRAGHKIVTVPWGDAKGTWSQGSLPRLEIAFADGSFIILPETDTPPETLAVLRKALGC